MNATCFKACRLAAATTLVVTIFLPSAGASAQDESWRFTHARPLSDEVPAVGDPASIQGRVLRFHPDRLEGPHPFGCEALVSEMLSAPAEGLFEGGLSEPAARSAAFLGLGPGPYRIRRIACDLKGGDVGFDLVEADPETLLVALDGRIWTLSRAPGARAAADAPEGRVQRLLEAHFSGDRGFLPQALENKSAWLSPRLRAAVRRYFSQPRPGDEVPPIDTDPFTHSQDPLTHFAVGAAQVQGMHARVRVRIAGPPGGIRLDYALVLEGESWQLDDIFLVDQDSRGLRATLEHD